MKRSPMPGRKAVLRSKTRLKSTPMPPRKKGLTRTRMKAYRPKVSPEEKDGKKVARARSGRLCEACGMRDAFDWQHRKNRAQMGTWSPENGLDVCRPCHSWIHGHARDGGPNAARALGWTVWSHEDPAVVPVRRRGYWVLLAEDGLIVPVLKYRGGPWQCMNHLERDRSAGGPLRCGLGVLHDGDHECGLVFWPQTSKEMAHG